MDKDRSCTAWPDVGRFGNEYVLKRAILVIVLEMFSSSEWAWSNFVHIQGTFKRFVKGSVLVL